VNAQNEKGNTPLHEVVSCVTYRDDGRYIATVKALLSHEKISVNLENQEGKSPLDLARDFRDVRVEGFLKDKEAKTSAELAQ
jgi:ankyrin repeat protein